MPTRPWFNLVICLIACISSACVVRATVTWTAGNGSWFTGSNWSTGSTPTGVEVLISSPYTITTNCASTGINLTGLDLNSTGAKVVFDFSSSDYGLNLGADTSTWFAGKVEFHTSSGLRGTGATSLTLWSGVDLLFGNTASCATRSISGISVDNWGAIRVTDGAVAITSSIKNRSGGLILADGADLYFTNTATLQNFGTIRASGSAGKLYFQGDLTTSGLGAVDVTDNGHAYIAGNLSNVGATLSKPGSGSYELYGGTISGGNIADGAIAFTNISGTLSDTTLNGSLVVAKAASVTLTHGTAISGGSIALGNSSTVTWTQTGTLHHKSVSFGDGSAIKVVGTSSALILDANTSGSGDLAITSEAGTGGTITNQGQLEHTSSAGGTIYAPTFTNSGDISLSADTTLHLGNTSAGYATLNTGNITVKSSAATLYLDGNFDNTGGTLNALSGAIVLQGNNTAEHLNNGSVVISSEGHVYLKGTLRLDGTLEAPTSGKYELAGGTLTNGTVAAGALTFGNGGRLQNVTLLGNVALPISAQVYWSGGTNLANNNASLTLGQSSALFWQQAGSLIGNTLAFGSGSAIEIYGENSSLTFGAGTNASGAIEVVDDGSSNTSLVNAGSVTNTRDNGHFYAQSVTNSGTLAVTGGTLQVGTSGQGASLVNTSSGVLRVNGGTMVISTPSTAALINQGTIDVINGTLSGGTAIRNTSSATIQGSGTIVGNITLEGGTLAPGNSGIGTLTVSSGGLRVTGAATFAVDIAGGSSDQLLFQYALTNVDLGNGLLTLSLNLLSAPTADTTYTLINISSGDSVISGTFAGLAANGSTLTANYGGSTFTFSLNYQPSTVSLTYNPVLVPEPSTYALMSTGILIAAVAYRRRRRR